MRKRLCFLLFVLAAGIAGCSEEETTGPTDSPDPANLTPASDITACFDPIFAQVLQERGYIANANKITFAEVNGITELNVVGWNEETDRYEGELTSLKGIEYFESLTLLHCYGNQLTALDMSKNTALTGLHCGGNQLMALEVSKNTALTYLTCGNNQLAALDVSKNTALRELVCARNQLTALDISKNAALTKLRCEDNPGDGSGFPVTAWFDNKTVPNRSSFTTGSWEYDGATITVDYRKAE